MRHKLVITLTTIHGSRQYTLGQLAKYIVLLFLVLSALSFFISNALLVKTSDELTSLSEEHQQLTDEYDLMLGSQQLYQSELDDLSESLQSISSERDKLVEEKEQFGSELSRIEDMLGALDDEPVQMTVQQRIDLAKAAARYRLFMLSSIPNGVPINGRRISDSYGMRTNPVTGKRVMHNGMDFSAKRGTPVYATADGVVEFAGYSNGYGRLIRLSHSLGFKTYFGHLKQMLVKPGEFVHKGQKIALSGNSGRSTGPHLHYEVRHLYTPLNPTPFLKWGLDNFDEIFTEVKEVEWASLKEMYPLNLAGTDQQ